MTTVEATSRSPDAIARASPYGPGTSSTLGRRRENEGDNMTGKEMRWGSTVAASALALGLAACGGSGGPSSATTKTVTAPAPASSGQAAPAPTTGPTSAASGASGTPAPAATGSGSAVIPDYQPSAVVSKTGSNRVLTSPDSVAKIGGFYHGLLSKGGWQIRSAASSAYSASFSAHRASEGVTISVYPRGSGSGISISTHPE
jgi:hypothetical protein